MKILILANNDVGLYKFRKELIDALLEENEVIICLPYGEFVDELEAMGCKFISCDLLERHGINPKKDDAGYCFYIYNKAEYLWRYCMLKAKYSICGKYYRTRYCCGKCWSYANDNGIFV